MQDVHRASWNAATRTLTLSFAAPPSLAVFHAEVKVYALFPRACPLPSSWLAAGSHVAAWRVNLQRGLLRHPSVIAMRMRRWCAPVHARAPWLLVLTRS